MLARVMLGVIRFYQRAVSPLTPPSCRFTPTCSQYAAEAVTRHGALKGAWLAARRIRRCHPLGGSGFDPVPPVDARGRGGRAVEGDGGGARSPGGPPPADLLPGAESGVR
ncbi:MAG: membrane protein insertion efficiency factor YidD [Gemmatimonadetes bacterium]|nr:MAG: membrane protein insertion efficiency factor YidD [Gemmatimonadota bacterium]